MSLVYNIGKKRLGNGEILWTTDTIKIMLVTSVYTVNADHQFVNSSSGANNPSANECSGTGYARQTVGSKTITEDDTNDRVSYDGADTTFTAVNGFTAAAAIVYKDTGSDATAPLIGYINSGGFPKTMNGSDFLIVWHAAGIVIAT